METTAQEQLEAITNCRAQGRQDAQDGLPEWLPAWGTIPAWNAAYREGYAEGKVQS